MSPTFDFGKGFGDLPDSLPWLRPFALTGNLSLELSDPGPDQWDVRTRTASFTASRSNTAFRISRARSKTSVWGPPFNRLIPLVEFALTTSLDRGQGGITTGTVQPGVIWAGQYFQVGAEMIIPTNSLSGHGIGGVFQFHMYLDDLFPNSIGRPISQW